MKWLQEGVKGPWLVCSGLGILVALILQLLGVFRGLDRLLMGKLEALSTTGLSVIGDVWLIVTAVVGVMALIAAMLQTPGQWRRVILLVTTCLLLAGLTIVCALYGVYFSSLSLLAGSLWSGGCALFYSMNHPLPVELA